MINLVKTVTVSRIPRNRKSLPLSDTMTIADILTNLADRHRADIESVRLLEYGSEDYRTAKRKLPMWFPSGVIERVDDNLQIVSGGFSGIMCIDVDGKDNPDMSIEDMKSIICAWDYTCYCSMSTGGRGVYALVKVPEDTFSSIDGENHYRAIFRAIQEDMQTEGIILDPACISPVQARFVSFDDDAYYNRDSFVYDRELSEPQTITAERVQAYTPDLEIEYKRMESLLDQSESIGRDIAVTSIEWFKCGCAFAYSFGDSRGWYLFERMSAIWERNTGKHHSTPPRKKYAECCKYRGHHPYDIGYVMNRASENGVRLK